MTSWIRTLSGGVTLCAMFSVGAVAQVSTNRVAANTDWSVFVDGDPAECWSVSAPKETVNTRDGKAVQARRGDILLFITYRAGKSVEVSFTGGYPFAPDSKVGMDVNGTQFELFSDGEWAWAGPEEDQKIIDALKSGTTAILTGRSSKGTNTQDTFSLNGFTAAVDEAAKRCSG